MINPDPIKEVTEADIGKPVSYAIGGRDKPEHGHVNGLSRIPGYVFIRYGGKTHGKLTALCDLQWGHVPELWWDEEERKKKAEEIAEYQKRARDGTLP